MLLLITILLLLPTRKMVIETFSRPVLDVLDEPLHQQVLQRSTIYFMLQPEPLTGQEVVPLSGVCEYSFIAILFCCSFLKNYR
jgi:hypothetical protein